MLNKARLPELVQKISSREKRWLIKKLKNKAPQMAALLDQDTFLTQPSEQNLPFWTEQLRKEPPLLVKAILDEGNYPWTESFLATYSSSKELATSPDSQRSATSPDLFGGSIPYSIKRFPGQAGESSVYDNLTKASRKLLASLWLKKHATSFDDLLEASDD